MPPITLVGVPILTRQARIVLSPLGAGDTIRASGDPSARVSVAKMGSQVLIVDKWFIVTGTFATVPPETVLPHDADPGRSTVGAGERG